MYKVSVVVVVYNTEKYLGQCLDSIFAQTLDNVEVVVVDNASNEETRIALEEKIRGRENVVFRRMETNVGGATGATIGIGMASGEYLFIMDSDDILPPDALEALYNAITEKSCDVAVGRAVSLINGKISTLRFPIDEITWARELTTDSLEKEPQLMVAPFFWGKLYKTSFIKDNNIYMKDGVINADRYMTTNALRLSSRTTVIRDITCIWRRHNKSGGKSVTMSAKEIESIRDRMQSLTDTAMLFPEGDLRQYALVSNLARVFLPVRSLKNSDIRSEYEKLIDEYLELVDEDKMIESTVLPVRYKVYSYLARRRRYDEIIALLSVLKTKTKRTEKGTFEVFGGLENVPDEVFRVRTVKRFDSISANVCGEKLCVSCKVSDTSLCKPTAAALYTADTVNDAVYECARPDSKYEIDENGGVMSFSVKLDESTAKKLLSRKKAQRLFLEIYSGDSVIRTEIPLSANALSMLYDLMENKEGTAKPKTVARKNAILRKLAPVKIIWEKVKSHL